MKEETRILLEFNSCARVEEWGKEGLGEVIQLMLAFHGLTFLWFASSEGDEAVDDVVGVINPIPQRRVLKLR